MMWCVWPYACVMMSSLSDSSDKPKIRERKEEVLFVCGGAAYAFTHSLPPTNLKPGRHE